MKQFASLLIGLLMGFSSSPAMSQSTVTCDSADNITVVAGGSDCLALLSFGTDELRPNGTLIVFLHGDVSSGGPSDAFRRIAPNYVGAGRAAVVLIRQGYFDDGNRLSTGSNYGRNDNATPDNIDNIGAALAKMKAHHRVARLVVIGHSRGSNIAGVLLGRRPGLIDAAVLFSCPCDLATRQKSQSAKQRAIALRSLSPLDFVSTIPANTWVATITGEKDDNTSWQFLKKWHEALKDRQVPIRDVILPNELHNWSTRWFTYPDFRALLDEAIGG